MVSIAILVAMLLPAISKAKARVRFPNNDQANHYLAPAYRKGRKL